MPDPFLILLILGLAAALLTLFFLYRDYQRMSAEHQRMSAEHQRVSAEHQRVKAEHQRTLLEVQQQAANTGTLQTQRREAEARADSLQSQLQAAQQQLEAVEQREKSLTTSAAEWQAHITTQQQAAELNRWLADTAYDGLIVLDTDLKVLATNKSAEDLLGIGTFAPDASLTDITQTPILEMMVEDALANEEDILEEQVTFGERSFLVRTQMIRADGITRIGIALHDITQLIRLNRARRDMVANISHELRTPIANIRLIIDGLFHDQDKPKRKESISSLRAIAHETETLLWLVQEMADLSMIESGQSIIRLVDVPLWEITEEATARLEDQMESKRLKLVRQQADDIHVLCDRDLIQRVIVNLLHNAMKWSPTGGTLTVTTEKQGDEAVVSIYDNGPGVPEDQVERIFERFYQVDNSRSAGEGTGLGLAICKHIITAHGGRVWAESNTTGNGGGRFKFTLLLAEEIRTAPAEQGITSDTSITSGDGN